ncbi:MAG: carboxypeptidase regulatory-like domain-containing protein [Bryobacterales bacterium]|nr:carboxypeptidase regulatory-like domain-containing protein [Bryobacterales bacterium]
MQSKKLAFLLLLPAAAWSQTTFATITGTVQDPAGAVVPGVTITVTNTATNIQTAAQSNELGVYTLAQLKEGTYTLRAKGAGFREFIAQDIVLVARDYRRLDIELSVGTVETSVEVQAGATLIETESARISDTKTAEVLKSIPLNTRGIWAFLSLSPSVLQAGGGSSTIRFAGSRSNQSHWAIDGTTMSDGVSETQIGPLGNYIESFQEIKVDVSNNTAEFGTIGQVTMISKSGTNQFKGNVFDYYSTPWFRARNPFALARGTGVSHTLGFTGGGPVLIPKLYNGRDKTFFFFSFETGRGSPQNPLLNPTVAPAPWRTGDFSAINAAIRDPFGDNVPFAGSRIPASRLNASSVRIQDRFFPLPNFDLSPDIRPQNYRENKIQPFVPSNYWTLRGDHRFSDKDSIYARFTTQDLVAQSWQGNLPTIGKHYQHRYNYAMTGAYTHSFKPTLINEFRYGFAFNNNTIAAPLLGNQLIRELGLTGLAPGIPDDLTGILKLSWTGIGLTGLTSLDHRNPGFLNFLQEFQDHVSWFRGRHSLKFGANVGRIEWDDGAANASLFGNLNFSNRFTGHPYADFLLGVPTTANRAFAPVRVDRLRYQYDFFVADDFKVNSRLTLNLGLRYEYHPIWTEQGGLGATFDIGTGKIVVQDGSLSKVSPIFPRAFVDVVEAKSVGLPGSTIMRADRNNFAPRFGFAWRPLGNRTVVRGGVGIYFDVVPRNITQGGVPFVLVEPTHTNSTTSPEVRLPNLFPSTGTGGPSSVGIPAAVNPDLKMPYSMQYNFTIEHSRWETGFRATYTGTNTRQGDYAYDINSPVPDNRPYADKPRLFPRYPGISYFTNGAGHQFHSLTLEAERQMAKGLYFQSSWVWARDIGDLERGSATENPFDRRRERAVWEDIPTHRFTTNLFYQLPFGRGRPLGRSVNKWANLALGGWDMSAIYSYYSGQFLTPLWTGPDPVGIAFSPSRTPANVTLRPDHLRNANLSSDQRSVNRWFDPSAFGPLSGGLGRFGSSAKGVIKGPDVNVWHMGLFKTFPIREGGPQLRWEMTATNFLNHPNYSNPGTNIVQTAAVGVITGVGGVNGSSTGDQPGARSFRMGLRFEW